MEIKYSRDALKFLLKQDVVTSKRIVQAIEKLPLRDIIDIGNRGQIYK